MALKHRFPHDPAKATLLGREGRDAPEPAVTCKVGDRVRISTPRLGVLETEVTLYEPAPPWTFGASKLMRNLPLVGLPRRRSKGKSDEPIPVSLHRR